MNRLTIILSVIVLLTTTLLAQRNEGMGEWGRMGGKIEQLEKIKIIEELYLDEETTLKFFSRRNEHRESQRALIEKRDFLYKTLSESFASEEDINYKEKTKEIFIIEKDMLEQRENFFNSLRDILSEKQMVQLVVFEFNFRNEVRHQFMKQGKRRMKHN